MAFFKEAYETFLWSQWKDISERPAGKGIGFFTRVLLLAFVVMLLLSIPQLIKLPGTISQQLSKFEKFQTSANVTMSSPIKLPGSNPVFILDTSGAYTELKSERVLITNDKIFWKPLFRTHELSTGELKDLKNNRDQVKTFLAMLAFFLLPSVLFWAFVAVWLKYFLMILLLSIILFILLDLTHWRRTWKEFFVIGCYVSLLPVLVEVIVGAIDKRFLLPVLDVFDLVTIYLIPVVVLCLLTIGAALCVYYNKKEKR